MKNLSKKTLAIVILSLIVIIAGIIMIAVKGFNFDLREQKGQKVELYLKTEFKDSDIKNITNEVFGKQPVMIQKVEVFEDTVAITTTSISDEQKNNLVTKINEKYGTELKAEDTEILDVAHTRGRDIIKPYILPFTIATLIILVYMAFRYHKLGTIKTVLKTIGLCAYTQIMLFSIMAITRIPVGRLTIPLVILIYLLTLVGITTRFEKKLALKKEEIKKKA